MAGAKKVVVQIGDLDDYAWTCPHCNWTVRVASEKRRRAEQAAHRFYCFGLPLSAVRR